MKDTFKKIQKEGSKIVATKSAFIAIIGRPNVGKSSLLNAIIGQKVAIVSDKPQTTRTRITGIKTIGETQLVFLDTPGAHRPRNRLGDFMNTAIRETINGVDAAVLVIEPEEKIRDDENKLLEKLRELSLPAVLVINKIDLLTDKKRLLACIGGWKDRYPFTAIIPISAVNKDGLPELIAHISSFAFESPHFFPDDTVSDQTDKIIAAEMIREKMLEFLSQEIPHGVGVMIEKFVERETGDKSKILDIEANILCERETHKGIIIGKQGAMLKKIASAARIELEKAMSCKINLQCWVKVKEDWRNKQGILGSFGYTEK